MSKHLTDEQVEQEIERLERSPLVQLGKAQYRINYRRRQRLSQLRWFEKNGKELADKGITIEMLEDLDAEIYRQSIDPTND